MPYSETDVTGLQKLTGAHFEAPPPDLYRMISFAERFAPPHVMPTIR
jgi:hypothetical protein